MIALPVREVGNVVCDGVVEVSLAFSDARGFVWKSFVFEVPEKIAEVVFHAPVAPPLNTVSQIVAKVGRAEMRDTPMIVC